MSFTDWNENYSPPTVFFESRLRSCCERVSPISSSVLLTNHFIWASSRSTTGKPALFTVTDCLEF